MALTMVVNHKIMNEVIKQHKDSWIKIEWRVLVVDHLPMKMINACCKMHDIADEGVTLVEDLYKERESIPTLDAIYLITPNERSVQTLINDFKNPNERAYRAAHVFFTEACPDDLFNQLCRAKVAKFIQTLKEINISFVPYERQVFSLETPDFYHFYYNPNKANEKLAEMERTAERIATLCVTLGEYPAIRYRADFSDNAKLARLVQQKLDAYKADDPVMGQGAQKEMSQLLILDRGFDCKSPVVHEHTYQAMVYDLLEIKNDVYKYSGVGGATKIALLDEKDQQWVELRHEHMSEVSQEITNNLKKFIAAKHIPNEGQSARGLAEMIKKMPEYQKELNKYSTHLNLAENCMGKINPLFPLCKVEQDFATGIHEDGEVLMEDSVRNLIPLLLDPSLNNVDKMRVIILYILSKNGLASEESLDKLVQHARLLPEEKRTILNLSRLGVDVIRKTEEEIAQIPRRKRPEPTKKYISRWIPIVKDLMEDCIDHILNSERFPFVDRLPATTFNMPRVYSARYGYWHKSKGQKPLINNVPRLIIFIVGGVTFSEMRCAYEVTKFVRNWEVIIDHIHYGLRDIALHRRHGILYGIMGVGQGSSHIITPKGFLDDLAKLSNT